MNEQDVDELLAVLAQHGHSGIDPTEDQLRQLLSGEQEGPFHFVNLLRFSDTASYPEGHELSGEAVSGAEAYDRYGAVAFAQVTQRGGRLMTLNTVQQQIIGKEAGWHRVATMEYQSISAFVEMLLDPDYQAALVHRNAGLAATEVIATRPLIDAPLG